MLVIAGHIRLDPAQRERAEKAALEVMEATRKEAGCLEYNFSADLQEPGRFWLFEQWESQEALEAHFATPHLARFQKEMGSFGVTELAIQKYQISAVGPVR